MPDQPNYQRLRVIQIAAIAAGAAMLAACIWLFDLIGSSDLAWIVVSVALTGIAFSAVFYFGCLFFEGSLQKYIVSDDTVIKGESVEMITTTEPSGDDQVDEWVRRYVFARNLFGLSVIPLLLLGGLFLFG